MKRISSILALLITFSIFVGCAPQAATEFSKLEPGMTRQQVKNTLGQPELITTVRFSGQPYDFEVWQYQMTPDVPLCPGDLAITAFTLGLSRLARTDLQPKPHWIYFQEGAMVYSSLAFDCSDGEICKITGKFTSASELKY